MPLHYDLPWNQSSRYWVALWADNGVSKTLKAALASIPAAEEQGQYLLFPMVKHWREQWQALYALIRVHGPAVGLHLALIPGEDRPNAEAITAHALPAPVIDRIAQSLWLGEVILSDQLQCYFQPVVDRYGDLWAHEAFARIADPSGSMRDALSLFQAAKNLGAEELLDQHLQVQAVKTLASADLGGFLFINMVPSILHKPEKYLAALNQTLAKHHIDADRIVLDIGCQRLGLSPHKMQALEAYCHAEGFGTALDDISSFAAARENLRFVTPRYLKLDVRLVHRITEPLYYDEISAVIRLAHEHGVKVIAVGVENDTQHNLLSDSGVDYFQGYLFSHPLPVEALMPKHKKKLGKRA